LNIFLPLDKLFQNFQVDLQNETPPQSVLENLQRHSANGSWPFDKNSNRNTDVEEMFFDKHYSFYLIVCNFVTAATFSYAYHHLSDEMRPPLMSYQYDIYDNILFFHQNHMDICNYFASVFRESESRITIFLTF
jgi:hypothetical protein